MIESLKKTKNELDLIFFNEICTSYKNNNMTKPYKRVGKVDRELLNLKDISEIEERLKPLTDEEMASRNGQTFTIESSQSGVEKRLEYLKDKQIEFEYLNGTKRLDSSETFKGNIENFIGMAQIPVGLAGPLWINGKNANGEFYIPLATTEGALIASYNRGMRAIKMGHGISTLCLSEGVQRSPYFKFKNIGTVGQFITWVYQHTDVFHDLVSQSSRFAKLIEITTKVEGNSVILTFEYTTGDAAGQNMVTICTDRICKYILSNFETTPEEWYIESNYSGDKKATALSFSNVRGKKVTSEVVIPKGVVERVLQSTPEKMVQYCRASTLAVAQSGAIGIQGHIANGLTALFIACGQDVACISESSVGITRMEVTAEGDLYTSVTLPSLIVGTVGGGTGLPTQKECLEMLDCYGNGKATKFAEICCAVALAGELSIVAAMSVDHFTRAHKKLGR